MASTSNICYLSKPELINELKFYNASANEAETIEILRKRLRQSLRMAKDGTISSVPIDVKDAVAELETCIGIIQELKNRMESAELSPANTKRLQVRSHYLLKRLARIPNNTEQIRIQNTILIDILSQLKGEESSSSDTDINASDKEGSEMNYERGARKIYVKERTNNLNSLNLKYDGTTCVRVFIERLEELKLARKISNSKILTAFSDIVEKSALLWFRRNRTSINTYEQLISKLKTDFDIPNLDLKVRKEIMLRTQVKGESVTIYLSVMAAMFSRLTKRMSEEEQLEILLNNIRPEYIRELALIEIQTIGQLEKYLRKLEIANDKVDNFEEPVSSNFKVTSDIHRSITFTRTNKIKTLSNVDQYQQLDSCIHCRKTNHPSHMCRYKQKVKCYRCGQEGVKVTNCNRCNELPSNQTNSKN